MCVRLVLRFCEECLFRSTAKTTVAAVLLWLYKKTNFLYYKHQIYSSRVQTLRHTLDWKNKLPMPRSVTHLHSHFCTRADTKNKITVQ